MTEFASLTSAAVSARSLSLLRSLSRLREAFPAVSLRRLVLLLVVEALKLTILRPSFLLLCDAHGRDERDEEEFDDGGGRKATGSIFPLLCSTKSDLLFFFFLFCLPCHALSGLEVARRILERVHEFFRKSRFY